MKVQDTQNLYRRLGKFLKKVHTPDQRPSKLRQTNETDALSTEVNAADLGLEHVYILAKSHHYGHELSFQKFSNCGWENQLHFSNGGLSVNLLKLNQTKVSEVKNVISAY
jgi:hypothetical protein